MVTFTFIMSCHRRVPPTFLGGSAPNLRILQLVSVLLGSFSRLLSSVIGLIDLSLNLKTDFDLSTTTSLLTYLQGMPSLRRLQLHFQFRSTTSSISDQDENYCRSLKPDKFSLFWRWTIFEALIAGLATPTLQNSLVVITDHTPTLASHLSRFINDVDNRISQFN